MTAAFVVVTCRTCNANTRAKEHFGSFLFVGYPILLRLWGEFAQGID